MFYFIAMGRSWLLCELRALVSGIGDVQSIALLKESETSNFSTVVEVVIKIGGSSVGLDDLC